MQLTVLRMCIFKATRRQCEVIRYISVMDAISLTDCSLENDPSLLSESLDKERHRGPMRAGKYNKVLTLNGPYNIINQRRIQDISPGLQELSFYSQKMKTILFPGLIGSNGNIMLCKFKGFFIHLDGSSESIVYEPLL